MAHLTDVALTTAELSPIEAEDIKQCYSGKQAPKANHQKLTKAQVVDGAFLMKLEAAAQEKELAAAARTLKTVQKAKRL
jgi:hypothetical protein